VHVATDSNCREGSLHSLAHLLEPDGSGEPGRPRADDADVIVHALALRTRRGVGSRCVCVCCGGGAAGSGKQRLRRRCCTIGPGPSWHPCC